MAKKGSDAGSELIWPVLDHMVSRDARVRALARTVQNCERSLERARTVSTRRQALLDYEAAVSARTVAMLAVALRVGASLGRWISL